MEYLRETVGRVRHRTPHPLRHLGARRPNGRRDDATLDGRRRQRPIRRHHADRCNFLFMCSGYYSYKGGYTPSSPAATDFHGQVVHPAAVARRPRLHGQDVVIIGSGATAVTLLPAMADDAAHVTMLQRSPTYMVSPPDHRPVSERLRKVLPDKAAYASPGGRTLAQRSSSTSRPAPARQVKKLLLKACARSSAPTIDVDNTSRPTYNPWDQRLCLVPEQRLLQGHHSGKASSSPTPSRRSPRRASSSTSGEELEADIIITATGLQLVTWARWTSSSTGAVDFSQDLDLQGPGVLRRAQPGVDVRLHQRVVDPSGRHRRANTCAACSTTCARPAPTSATPRLRPRDRDMPQRPWIDDFSSGYMQRMMPMLPSRATGSRGSTPSATPRTRS